MKILTFMILFLIAGSLFADVPNEITYSGRLREYGQPINAKRMMNFKIYSTFDAPGLVWESGNVEIQVTSGVFTYKLQPTNVDWCAKDYWIETVVSGKTLVPREKITSQVYALHSRTSEDIEKTAGNAINFKIGSETKSKIDTTGEFANFISGTTYYTVPRGAIIMWSGAAIPTGWSICNGTNGTPDLRDRFVMGAGGTYVIGNSGGQSTVTLSVDQIPSHSHGIGNHNHTANHSHVIPSSSDASGGGKSTEGNSAQEIGLNTSAANVTTSDSGAGTTSNTGSTQGHENKPPYYALAFIMKL